MAWVKPMQRGAGAGAEVLGDETTCTKGDERKGKELSKTISIHYTLVFDGGKQCFLLMSKSNTYYYLLSLNHSGRTSMMKPNLRREKWRGSERSCFTRIMRWGMLTIMCSFDVAEVHDCVTCSPCKGPADASKFPYVLEHGGKSLSRMNERPSALL